MWKGNENTIRLLFPWKELEILHQERRGQNTIVMELMNSILFYKSGPANEYISINNFFINSLNIGLHITQRLLCGAYDKGNGDNVNLVKLRLEAFFKKIKLKLIIFRAYFIITH